MAILTKSINERISPKNNQQTVVKRFYIFLVVFGLLTILPHLEWSPLSGFWALSFISFFIFISSLVIMWMFRSRSEKLQTLISGENLLAEWTLTEEQKERYINYFYEQEKGKNMGILFSISFVASIVFGLFILFIEEGKLAMMGVLLTLILFLSFFALVMPLYYRYSNRKEDGHILIGGKYAYINGYFHNWDFMLSGLSRITIIKEPFYGINLVYYYTDKTFRHSEEIFIPANEDIDLEILISSMKELNKLKSAPKKLQ
ncbi:MAG: Unknown protein [uncultured Sulfurovum sp.]|uniref:Uncharacterized protein n=1 Tax=uncultured Sulfurovum sp. TaxID=269237 RepID=A0A6S6UE46_9BACT|nr:MAG: Unknown protein [uncultured Sulfurovum sp.]